MKKAILLCAALAATCSAFAMTPSLKTADKQIFNLGPKAPAVTQKSITRASDYIDFTYAGELYSAFSMQGVVGGKSRVFMFFEMSSEDIKAFAGNKVTGFTVYSPTDQNGESNTITEGRFFYSTDLTKEDYSQDFTMSKTAFDINEVTMDTPYTITGKEDALFFGYSILVPRSNDMYYVMIDYIPNEPATGIVGVSADDSFPKAEDLQSFAPYYGALCMSIKIEGDKLPVNMATIKNVGIPPYLPISGNGANVNCLIQNRGTNEVESVELTASVTGMPDVVQTIDFDPISFGESAVVTLTGLKAKDAAFVDLSLKISKVNDEICDGGVYETSVPAYENGFPMKIVAEDATGTWCGWCPGGIEALEYLKTNYPDRAIAIGVHNGDEMEIDEYQKFIQEYVSGFPTIWYNRMISMGVDDYDYVCGEIENIVAYLDFPSYAQVALKGKSNDDGTAANITVSTEFAIASSVPHYLSFVIVEDGVGPYVQTNYYKQQKVPMNGWEKKANKVTMKFNDVARYYDCFPGIENSLPSEIEANSVNDYSIELPLSSVTGNEYRVVALLTNGLSGNIVNAAELNMAKDNNTAVEGIFDDNAPVEYFNLNGQKVANPSNGIFLRRQGASTSKVIIR